MVVALNDRTSDSVWEERRTERMSEAERWQRMWTWISLGREKNLSPRVLPLTYDQRDSNAR
jgi:hypothetical protein